MSTNNGIILTQAQHQTPKNAESLAAGYHEEWLVRVHAGQGVVKHGVHLTNDGPVFGIGGGRSGLGAGLGAGGGVRVGAGGRDGRGRDTSGSGSGQAEAPPASQCEGRASTDLVARAVGSGAGIPADGFREPQAQRNMCRDGGAPRDGARGAARAS